MEARRKLGTVKEENVVELKQGTTDFAFVNRIHEADDDQQSTTYPEQKKIVSDEAIVESKTIKLSQVYFHESMNIIRFSFLLPYVTGYSFPFFCRLWKRRLRQRNS